MRSAPDRSVRPAQPGDEGAIARLQVLAWSALMGDQALAAQGVTEELLARQWEATLAAPRPVGSAALVALHANTIAGFALAGPDEAGAQPRVRCPAALSHGPGNVDGSARTIVIRGVEATSGISRR